MQICKTNLGDGLCDVCAKLRKVRIIVNCDTFAEWAICLRCARRIGKAAEVKR